MPGNKNENSLETAVHDLRNPLTIIRGVSQLALKETSENKAHFQQIIKQVDVITGLLNELMSALKSSRVNNCENTEKNPKDLDQV
ncbi:MAG: histidine kinase dimerization/phospho-acceptor domain-containing protein [Bacillota bacterium]